MHHQSEAIVAEPDGSIRARDGGDTVTMSVAEFDQDLRASYVQGLIAGLRRFAWWVDGVQMVGTCGTTLQRAIEDVRKEFKVPT